MQRLLGLIPRLLIALVATALAAAVFERASAQQGALDWSSADGEIMESRVLPGAGIDGRWMHQLELVYTYRAGGSSYVGERVTALGPISVWLRGGPGMIAERYEPGDPVEVFYQAGSPTNALLEPGMSTVELILVGLGIGLPALLAIGAIRQCIKRFAESSDQAAYVRADQQRRASGVDAFNRVAPTVGQRPRRAA